MSEASSVERTVRPLVERLREGTYYGQHALMNEAADEIEKLRAEVFVLRDANERWKQLRTTPRLRTGGWWSLTGARIIVESNHPAGMTTHRELTDAERAEWAAWLGANPLR